MLEVEVYIPAHASPAAVPQIIEQVCAVEGLTLTLKDTSAKYPNSVHWAFQERQGAWRIGNNVVGTGKSLVVQSGSGANGGLD